MNTQNKTNDDASRLERVHNLLSEWTSELLSQQGFAQMTMGFDASSIGESLGILRNNTSKELNKLYRDKMVIKIMGKPIRYLDAKQVELRATKTLEQYAFDDQEEFIIKMFAKEPNGNDHIESAEVRHTTNRYQLVEKDSQETNSAFDNIVGSEGSLKASIEQAKAAVLYPPKGLSTLITGPTGSGKTTFAETMYRYAVETKRFPEHAPFVVFNCADYADNPQLLNSQLFGYMKGSFTGADKDRAGLVEQADNGILFLDEVHRLPPEGQEMLFMLLDKGVFRRLGESANTRAASVFLIAATTEDPNSALLKTFIRRIPVLIHLPSLEERTLEERLAFIHTFFAEESLRVGVPIKVSKEIIKAFLLYDCPGNIGQLKSDIQMICATAFLDYITYKREQMEVKLSQVSQKLMDGFFRIQDNRALLTDFFGINTNEDYIFDGKARAFSSIIDVDNDEHFYEQIMDSWDNLSEAGLNDNQKREQIAGQIDKYFSKIYTKAQARRTASLTEIISKIVDPRLPHIINTVLETNDYPTDEQMSERTIYGLALHMNAI
ncbi:sigma-54-dependent transcriptional regulator, partial [Eubacteriales bacterium OttesenSCG-928-N14]|nr:sigma-54-dependent transcriptional regulator [Eubacteriales bacterium OttesenSCG-928-N14]